MSEPVDPKEVYDYMLMKTLLLRRALIGMRSVSFGEASMELKAMLDVTDDMKMMAEGAIAEIDLHGSDRRELEARQRRAAEAEARRQFAEERRADRWHCVVIQKDEEIH